MKFITKNWSKNDDGILFFFQRLEEMLYPLSDDIVRMPIHNTRTLMLEYMKNQNEMKNGKVMKYQIEQILQELTWSVQNDKILVESFGETFVESVVNMIRKNESSSIHYLHNKIADKKYYELSIEYLKKHVTQSSHKKEIEHGLRAWTVEMIQRGYSPTYMYEYLKDMMSNENDPSICFDSFMQNFDLNEKEYRIYLLFDASVHEYKALLAARLNINFDDDGTFEQIKKRKNDFIGFVKIKSLDRYRAVEQVYANVSIFIKYYRVISNRCTELVRMKANIVNESTGDMFVIPVKPLGYRSVELEPSINIQGAIDSIIIECQSKTTKDYLNLSKMVDLHNDAIEQHDLKDGFLNLWSILEIVTSDIQKESKIEKIIEGVIPILQKDYFSVLMENIEQDLKDNLSRKDFDNLIHTISSKRNMRDVIAKFVFLPEFEKLREEYFLKLSAYPIIRNKIYILWELKDCKHNLLILANNYSRRVKWHIYRLYRTRNAIVHSGTSHMRIQELGEHLHIYIDRILNEILWKLSTEKTLRTISDVLMDTKLSLQKINECLEKKQPVLENDLPILHENFFYKS